MALLLEVSVSPKSQPTALRNSLLAHLGEMAAPAGRLLALDLGDREGADACMKLVFQVARETDNAELSALERLSPEMLLHRCTAAPLHRCTAFISRAEAHVGAGNVDRACADGDACVFVEDTARNLPPAEELGIATVLVTDPVTAIAQLEALLGLSPAEEVWRGSWKRARRLPG